MIASELLPDVKVITGACDDATALAITSDAIEALSNKGKWDARERRIILPVTAGYVTLPSEVGTVLAATLDGKPAFARNRLYEYDLNGAADGVGRPVAYSFTDDMDSPLFIEPTLPFQLRYVASTGTATIQVKGRIYSSLTSQQIEGQYTVTGTTAGPMFSKIYSVSKSVQALNEFADLFATTSGGEQFVARYAWNETSPLYRRLKVDPRAASIKLLYLARTYRLASANDFIALNSRLAVLYMVRALKHYANDQDGLGDKYEAKALQYLAEEQMSRDSALAHASQQQAAAAIGLNIHAANLVTCADIYDTFAALYPGAGRARIFDRISDAVEALANTDNFSPLLIYVVLGVQNDYYVSLPPDVESVLRATIEDAPAFARSRLYEFSLNGPGSAVGKRASVGYEDLGEVPTFVQPTGTFQLRVGGGSAALRVTGEAVDGSIVRDHLLTATATDCPAMTRIDAIVRDPADVSGAQGSLYAEPGAVLLATVGAEEEAPRYRRLRLSKKASGVRLLCRKRTTKIRGFGDVIPLNNRLAILTMGRALKALALEQADVAAALKTAAIQFLTDEQTTREAQELASHVGQNDSALGVNIHAANLVTAGDVYDSFAEIYPGVGRERIYDRITDAVEALANTGTFSSLLVYVVLGVQNDYYISLPADIEDVIRATIEDEPAFARSRLYEFSLNGPGSGAGQRASVGYEDLGEVATFVQPTGNFQLRVGGGSAPLRVSGEAADGSAVRDHLLTTSETDCPVMTRIDAVLRDSADVSGATATLYAEPGAVLLSTVGPEEDAPRYRRLRLSKKAQGVRLLCRRRTAKIRGLGDVIPLNSRLAVTTMGRALKAFAMGEGDAGRALKTDAVQFLQDEQSSRSAHEMMVTQDQKDAARGLNIHSANLTVCSDVFDQFAEMFPGVGTAKVFDRITDAVEALANKGNFSPLLVYVVLGVQNDYYVSLPPDVEDVIRGTIEDEPAFARTRLYEFSLNGPGSAAGPRSSVGWEDLGEVATYVQPTGTFRLKIGADSAVMRVTGLAEDGTTVTDHPLTEDSYDCPKLTRIDYLVRDPDDTTGAASMVYADPGRVLLTTVGENVVSPRYRRLRLSKKAQGVRFLCRRRTARVTSLNDVIPLHSRIALTTMGQALKAFSMGDEAAGSALEATAARFINEEQATRETHQTLAQISQDDAAIGIPIHAVDVLTVGDVYDEAAAILGPVGRSKVFDAITDAVQALQNKSLGGWDSQQGVVDLAACSPTGDAVYTLPREVDEIIAVRANGAGMELRGKWMQFSLGRCNSSCMPCGMWEKLPESFATQTTIVTPVRLVARLAAGTENDPGKVRVFGKDSAGKTLYQSGHAGVELPIHPAGFDPTTLGSSDVEMTMPTTASISRVWKPATVNFVELLAIDATSKVVLYTLGTYYPDRNEERFRRIRVPGAESVDSHGACLPCITVAFRRKQEKVESFTDIIWTRSRDAVVGMVRARKLRATDPQAALVQEQMAVQALVEEQASRNPAETFTLQVAPEESLSGDSWGIY